MRPPLTLSCTLSALLLLHLPTADARGRMRLGTGLRAGAQHTGPVLTREQLRACLTQRNHLEQEGRVLDELEAAQKQKKTELEHLESVINEREPLVDRYSQISVDNFNALITEHRERVQAHNAEIPAFQIEISKYNAAQKQFNRQCGDRAYYVRDMDAINAGR